jgi:hypothetical protein
LWPTGGSSRFRTAGLAANRGQFSALRLVPFRKILLVDRTVDRLLIAWR